MSRVRPFFFKIGTFYSYLKPHRILFVKLSKRAKMPLGQKLRAAVFIFIEQALR